MNNEENGKWTSTQGGWRANDSPSQNGGPHGDEAHGEVLSVSKTAPVANNQQEALKAFETAVRNALATGLSRIDLTTKLSRIYNERFQGKQQGQAR
ncbi:MAG: hypothetical protein KGJ06_07775 [Pseudomonadota bacterium]|nr:hypothetical protein [Pseudomonadota bacterium]